MDEAGRLKEQLFAGEITYPEVFSLIVSREPRVDVLTLTDVERVDAAVLAA